MSKTFINNNSSTFSQYTYFYIYREGVNDSYISMYLYKNPTDIRVNSNQVFFSGGQNIRYRFDGIKWFYHSGGNSTLEPIRCYSTTAQYYNSLLGMLNTPQPIEDIYTVPATYVGNQAIPRWTYLEYTNSIEDSTHNGNLFTYYVQGNLYSQAQMKIGFIVPYDSYYYEINLINNNNNIKVGQCFVSEDPYYPYSTGALYIDEHHDVYINTINVDYSTQYRLEVTSYYGDGGDNLFEDIDWYIFLPQNAVISGDSILNFGSGDYSIKDNTIAIIGALEENQQNQQDFLTDSSEVNNELDNFFSGDTDAIVSNLNFPNLNNNYFVVIYNVVSGITDTLQMSGDPYFDVQLHGETPKRIYASDFTTPNGVLKNFVSMALIFGTLYILYLQLSGFITMLNTGHIKDAINQIDDISGYTIYKM